MGPHPPGLAKISPSLPLFRDGPILLYDGECGVCNRAVQWILEHERSKTLRFAALESPLGHTLQASVETPTDLDSLIWLEVEAEEIKCKYWSDSLLATMKYVGGPWRYFAIAALIPKALRDPAYRLFARYRRRLVSKSCTLPPAEERARFLSR